MILDYMTLLKLKKEWDIWLTDMHETNTLFFLKKYIKDHIKLIVFSCIAILIFELVIWLYRLPISAILYAALLCFVVAIIFIAHDFHKYIKVNKSLMGSMASIAGTIDNLPVPQSFTDEGWKNLLIMSYANNEDNREKINNMVTEMEDYYTMWAHQIKTPIAAMRLLLQSKEHNISNNIKKELSNELFKIEQYVEMVLSYMRLESDSTDYVIEEYDIDQIVRQAAKKFSTPFINKKLSLNFGPTGLKVLTDKKWLCFAIEQILSNAVKYTEKGSVTIRKGIESESTNKKNGKHLPIILVIEDTGIGIAPEDLPRIFEKGYTGYNGRVENKSTGIGLFLTKRILLKLGHSIVIESELGQCTKVILDFTKNEIEMND